MEWEDDHEWQVKDMETGSHGLFQGTMPTFT